MRAIGFGINEGGGVGASQDESVMWMREAVDLLASGWPEDYPAGAVEGLILQSPKALIETVSSRHTSKLIR
ncbi:hypothetical protein PTKU46_58550 [Paraburkholderia terrae]